jgi:hypothetical protein
MYSIHPSIHPSNQSINQSINHYEVISSSVVRSPKLEIRGRKVDFTVGANRIKLELSNRSKSVRFNSGELNLEYSNLLGAGDLI